METGTNIYKNKKVLVTGGTGMIGRQVVDSGETWHPVYGQVFIPVDGLLILRHKKLSHEKSF